MGLALTLIYGIRHAIYPSSIPVTIADWNFSFNTIRGNVTMAKSVSIFWLMLFVAPLASAQIFKCVAKNGTDLYQNFPCGIDSIGSMPTDGQSGRSEQAGLAQS